MTPLGTPSGARRVPLWRDVRVLKWVVQLAIVAVVVAIVSWLWGNYTSNAARANIPTGFDFLDNPASFQITGNSLSQNASVREALYQGLLNTLRVSVAAVIAATILGTLVGIGRLSQNWIVRKISTVYVEVVRNIPLALFLVTGFIVIVLGVFPNINDAWDFLGLVILSNRGIAVPWFEGGSGRGLLLILLAGARRVVGRRPLAAIGVEPHGHAGTVRPVGRARVRRWSWSCCWFVVGLLVERPGDRRAGRRAAGCGSTRRSSPCSSRW